MTDDHTYNTESLHTPESRERDARLVGHEWKGEAIGDDPKCEAGCISYYGGEKKHHKDCPYYPESLTKLNADRIRALLAERDALNEGVWWRINHIEDLEAENQKLREALAEQSRPGTCHEAYSGRKMQDPECRAGEYGDDCREAIGLPPLCQYNVRIAEQEKTDD